jgi:hypothetical protein
VEASTTELLLGRVPEVVRRKIQGESLLGTLGQGWLTIGCEAEDDDAEHGLDDAQREDESFEHFENFL